MTTSRDGDRDYSRADGRARPRRPAQSARAARRQSGTRAIRALAACALTALAGCATMPPDAALRSLVTAEREFARMSADAGLRAAFLANFADDGVNFQPAPVNIRQAFAARPAPADPKGVTLAWEPVAAGIARSGDFGFTTGPYTLTDNRGGKGPQHGVYFSIWKREPDGRWRVAVDIGIETPRAVAPDALLPSPALPAAAADPEHARRALAALEGVPLGDYASAFAADGRLHRDGKAPVLGRERIRAEFPGASGRVVLTQHALATARSGDLAYTYGTAALGGSAAPSPPRWYVHLWARDAEGTWRIVVATLLP